IIAELARKIPLDAGGSGWAEVLLHGPDTVWRADCRHCPAEQAYAKGLIGLEMFPALLRHFGWRLLGRLVDAQGSPFHLGAAAGHSSPEGQSCIAVEAQSLGHHCCPEGQNRGSVHADRSAVLGGVHAQTTQSAPGSCRNSAMALGSQRQRRRKQRLS